MTETTALPALPVDVPGRLADACGLQIFTDGCFEPRSCQGGWAFVAYRDGAEVAVACGGLEKTANNRMELMAVLQAILWIQAACDREPALIWSDSVYVVEGCNRWRPIWRNNGWKRKMANSRLRSRAIADADLWKSLDSQLSPGMAVAWCKGHSGIGGNERADRLAEQGRLSLTNSGKIA